MANRLLVGLRIAYFGSILWGLIPNRIRRRLLFVLLLVESRCGPPDLAIRQLYLLSDSMEWILNERALAYGNGVHPKIRVMGYHSFFVDNVISSGVIVDIGCGTGTVSHEIAINHKSAFVIGIDHDAHKICAAKSRYTSPNLEFHVLDASQVGSVLLNVQNSERAITVIMSNVLEHLEDRVVFLRRLVSEIRPKKLLIRVPSVERSWHVKFRKELGLPYFSDTDHKTEYTLEQLETEVEACGFRISEYFLRWGEIWGICDQVVS